MAPKEGDLGRKKADSSNNEVNKAGSSKNKDIESNPKMQQSLEAAAERYCSKRMCLLTEAIRASDDEGFLGDCFALICCLKKFLSIAEIATYMARTRKLTPRTIAELLQTLLPRDNRGTQAYLEYSTQQERIRSQGTEASQEDQSIIERVLAIREELHIDTTGQEQMESAENRSRAKEVQDDGGSLEAQEINVKEEKHTLEETAGIMSQMNISGKEEHQNISSDAARKRNEHQENHDDQQGPQMTATLPQILDTLMDQGNQVRRDMQSMRDRLNNTDQTVKGIRDFLYNEFDRKIQKAINDRLTAIGPSIAHKVVTDVKNFVANQTETEVKKAMDQVEEKFSSKVKESNESMSTQMDQNQKLLRSDFESCMSIIQQKNLADSDLASWLLY